MAMSGRNIWAAIDSYVASGVSEFNANTGMPIRLVTAKVDHVRSPSGICISDGDVWVTSGYDGSVAELNSRDGLIVRVIDSKAYHLEGASTITADGEHLWVLNPEESSITEIEEKSGSLVHVIHLLGDLLTAQQVWGPNQLVSDGRHVWVSNVSTSADTVMELNPRTGAIVRSVNMGSSTPNSTFGHLFLGGSHLWVTNSNGTSLTLLNATTGSVIRDYDLKAVLQDGENALVQSGSELWVTGYLPNVVELNWRTGSITRDIRLPHDVFTTMGPVLLSRSRVWFPVIFANAPSVAKDTGVIELDARNGSIVRTFK
jgi:streptogramin lyase